jgi:hypothetical protein
MEWIFKNDKLPEIGKEVLCFYVIGDFEYYTVGKIMKIWSSTTGKAGNYKEDRNVEWVDNSDDSIEPLYWMEFPLVNLTA